ncbi:MAG: class II aldolase/adducin family protein [Pseudomonadota bacterium]|nr:class II aldolase/adducin family protein [Pseudomonadota bacterium]
METCLAMNASGINQGTSGNVSVRWGEGLLITPSALAYAAMTPADIVYLAPDGPPQGARPPSSEWRFHRDILMARPDVEAVVHCHSTFATALACHSQDIPAFHYMVAVAGGTSIRCADYATFGGQELSDAALVALRGRMACLLGQHGQISLGASLDKALWLAVEVETLAKMYVHARALGVPPVLSDDEMTRVLAKMGRLGYADPEG